ncbi:phosphotransferase family protein [Streptomyces sp. NPDC093544]|uniref:phosphotransferase family protein n=1 Tax=Streptomyces sp. NPDC093544 TaxID=3155200 RepID=UPI003432C685
MHSTTPSVPEAVQEQVNATREDLSPLVRLERLAPALAAALDDERWLRLDATLLADGKSNLTFEITSEAGAVVLRRPPSGALLPRAHDMGREARVQRALRDSAVPVAAVLLDDLDGELIGAPFYVMEKVPGHVIRDRLPPAYAEAAPDRTALADALIDVLVALHAVGPAEVGLTDFGRPTGFLERQVRRWQGQWAKSKTRDVPALDELGAGLAALLERVAMPRSSIVHGDFRLDNCLMDLADPGRVAAVLDWELSTLGDPMTDLGLLLFYWREAGETESPLTPTVTTGAGFPGRAYLAQRYAAATGASLDHLALYEAFAHFKFAVIAQGIAARVAAGAMAGQDFGNLDAEVVRCAEEGMARLGEEGR